jgi:cytosine/adenosine deaminase-related metal-dependent hydrolase
MSVKTKLINNLDYVVTLDGKNTIHENGSILIEGNRLKAIGKNLPDKADEVIEGKGKIAFPGMVNTHHHLYQTLTRNIPYVQDMELFDWLVALYEIWRELTPEAVTVSTMVGLGELLLTGCTTSTDMFYVFPRETEPDLLDCEIQAARKIGMRFQPCRGSMSRGRKDGGLPPDEVVQTEEEILSDCRRVIEKYHDPAPFAMTRISLGPCSPFSVTGELMEKTIKLAREAGVRVHTHLAETADEEEFCLKNYGVRPFGLMEKMGWLGEDVWFAHCVHLNDEEIAKMGKSRTGVAHCPVSNLRLGSGIAPVPRLLAAGAPVGLAVDGSASNDSSDMWGEMRTCLLAHRFKSGTTSVTAESVLRMAARGGAEVLGWKEIGSLEEGKAADLFLVNARQLGFAGGMHDPIGALSFLGDSHLVDTTIVNGEVVVRGGKLVNADEAVLFEEAQKISREMMNKARARTGIDYLAKKQTAGIF